MRESNGFYQEPDCSSPSPSLGCKVDDLVFFSDERDAVQKKTFTKWVNSHLARVSCRISDLYNDLRDGYMLTRLLEVLSGELLVGKHKYIMPNHNGPCINFVVSRNWSFIEHEVSVL